MPEALAESKQVEIRKKIFGVKIRHARTRAGLSQKDVGQALGMSADLISDMEFGRRDVSLPQLEVMAHLFKVPIIYFWSEEGIEEPDLSFKAKEALALRQRIIGVLLRQARAETGRSQEDLANLLNVPTSRISAYEFGKIDIPLYELEALCEYLNVSLNYFMDKGLQPHGADGQVTSLEEIANYSQLPPEVRDFLVNPANLLYINIAMKLSKVSADTLRGLAEGLLEVTY